LTHHQKYVLIFGCTTTKSISTSGIIMGCTHFFQWSTQPLNIMNMWVSNFCNLQFFQADASLGHSGFR
jgi:hypothetical protein